TGATSHRPPERRVSNRVRKASPVPFETLRGRAARDHDEWLARLVAGTRTTLTTEAVERTAVAPAQNPRPPAALHRTPDLGNKTEPVDELVYIILSRRTREGAYQQAYKALKVAFTSWDALAAASLEEIEGIIAFSGLGRRKAISLKSALSAL